MDFTNLQTTVFKIKRRLPTNTELKTGDLVNIAVFEDNVSNEYIICVYRAYTTSALSQFTIPIIPATEEIFNSYFEVDEDESKYMRVCNEEYKEYKEQNKPQYISYNSKAKVHNLLSRIFLVVSFLMVLTFVVVTVMLHYVIIGCLASLLVAVGLTTLCIFLCRHYSVVARKMENDIYTYRDRLYSKRAKVLYG